jgi:hypothetical protein
MSKNIKYATESLKKFDYTVKDFENWYNEFVSSADAWVLDGKDRYQALLRVLDPSIMTRVMRECRDSGSLPKRAEEMTEKWLVEELRKRFAYNDTVYKRLMVFLDRKKRKEETLEGYLIEKRELFMKYVEMSKKDAEALT